MCILDLSKTPMYDFHYNYIKQKYGNKAKKDVYADFWSDKNKFDNNDYTEDSRFHDKTNKKKVGLMKDESCGVPITEFVGLR